MDLVSNLTKRETQLGVGTCNISDLAKKYVNEVLDSNRLTYGPFSKKFEQIFAAAHNCKYAVLLNSGTSALRIAVAALKEKYQWADGDEILLPTITFVADVNVVIHNNLTPVFVDIHDQYYNMDPLKIEAKITPRTKAILVSHLFGGAADMDAIMDIAQKHDLRIIEDACESSFAMYKGKPVGSFSEISCFSTYQAHIVATGVGGLALTNDPELAVTLRSLANHGRDGIYMQIDDDKGKTGEELRQIVSKRCTFVRPGYSFRATEMEAAIGLAQVEESIANEITARQKNAASLTAILQPFETDLQLPAIAPENFHVFMMYPIVIKTGSKANRDDLVNFLESYNVETRRMLPLLDQPYILERYGDLSAEYPVGDHVNKNGFYIASHPDLTEEEITYIGAVFSAFFAQQSGA